MRLSFLFVTIINLFLPVSFATAEILLCTVEKVVDGDTVRALCDGDSELIRLIGIDSPESVDNEKAHRQASRVRTDLDTIIELGKRSGNYLKSVLSRSEKIRVETDTEKRDKYKRLLGYIYTQDGQMVNEQILRSGYAQLLTMPPNVKYVERLKIAYLDGRRAKRGLWGYEPFKGLS